MTSSPATSRRLGPCTPKPTMATFTWLHSRILRVARDLVEPVPDVGWRHWNVAVVLALDGSCEVAENRRDHGVVRLLHGEGGVREQGIARADRIDDVTGEALERE